MKTPYIKIKRKLYSVNQRPQKTRFKWLQRFFNLFSKGPREYPTVNSLLKEYELIKNKKSKLPRRQRDYVEQRFNKHFTLTEFNL